MANNATVLKDNAFTEEYAVFNYIMVAASCGLLLIVMVIARVFCYCNKGSEYDKVEFDTERTFSNDFIIQTERTKPNPEFVANPQIPGEVYEEQLDKNFKKDSPLDEFYERDEQYHRGIWHTAPNSNIDPTVRIFH